MAVSVIFKHGIPFIGRLMPKRGLILFEKLCLIAEGLNASDYDKVIVHGDILKLGNQNRRENRDIARKDIRGVTLDYVNGARVVAVTLCCEARTETIKLRVPDPQNLASILRRI